MRLVLACPDSVYGEMRTERPIVFICRRRFIFNCMVVKPSCMGDLALTGRQIKMAQQKFHCLAHIILLHAGK